MKRLFKLPLTIARVRADLGDELDFHLAGRIDELVATGMTREAAEREARRRFGNREQVEAEVARIDARIVKRRRMSERFEAFTRDVRYAVRGLVRKPLYACAAILTLALAIGANTAIFSIFDAVLLRPFPLPHINRLVVVYNDSPLMNQRKGGVSALESLDLFQRKDLFSVGAAVAVDLTTFDIKGVVTRASGTATVGEFWTLTGARPLYGRVYSADDSKFGSPATVVLSHRLWLQISGDTAIVGTTIKLGDVPYEVVGIMPAEFSYPRNTGFWRPAVLDATALDVAKSRRVLIYHFVGRMQPGVNLSRVNMVLPTVADDWHTAYPGSYAQPGHTMNAESFVSSYAGSLKPIVLALFGAVTFVLLIACANIGSLQLVRAAGRARELAVRAALGAGRAAIARQLVVESALLVICGGALGVALAKVCLILLAHANVAQFPALRALTLNATVLAFTIGTVVLAAVLCGSAPVLRAARADVNDVLRDAGRGSSGGVSRHHFLRASVIVQNALVLVLLIGAGLTVRSLMRLVDVDRGFNADGVMTFGVGLPSSRYNGPARLAFFQSLEARLAALPGVQSVGFSSGVPFTSSGGSTLYALPGVPERPGEPQRHANQAFVYGDYFKTMGIRIVQGRDFVEGDQRSGPTTVVVDENLVEQSFGPANPIGAEINHGAQPGPIIGVARTIKQFSLEEDPHPLAYHDYGHAAGFVSTLTAVVRTTLTPGELTKAARAIIAEMDPRLPIDAARSLSQRIDDTVGPRRLVTNVLIGFAGLALILALLGLYAVMSYVVGQRSREIGIRVALGAQRQQVAGMVLRDGAMLAAIGLAVGAATFVGFGRVLSSLMFGVSLYDPATIAIAVLLLAVVTLVACWIPARRAVRVDPVVTLRAE